MKFLPPSQDSSNRNAIFWALVSQSVWLPVFLFGSQDQLSNNPKDYNSLLTANDPQRISHRSFLLGAANTNLDSSKIGSSAKTDRGRGHTGILLNSILSQQGGSLSGAVRSFTDRNPLNSTFGTVQIKHSQPSEATGTINADLSDAGMLSASRTPLSTNTFIQKLYSRSELLGGTLTLKDLSEPIMPPIARAERAQWSRSGDPLAPLPEIWREPMRRALTALTKESLTINPKQAKNPNTSLHLDSARFVHIPSARIRQASEIPLALQADGSVDILNKPEDPVVIDEIKRWSAKQTLPEKGKISPAVIHLHPMEPLKSVPLQQQTLSSRNSSQQSSAESTLPPTSSPEPMANPVPAATSAVEESSDADSTPPLSSSATPESASPPEPLPASRVGS
jgi:hypothetical protein